MKQTRGGFSAQFRPWRKEIFVALMVLLLIAALGRFESGPVLTSPQAVAAAKRYALFNLMDWPFGDNLNFSDPEYRPAPSGGGYYWYVSISPKSSEKLPFHKRNWDATVLMIDKDTGRCRAARIN